MELQKHFLFLIIILGLYTNIQAQQILSVASAGAGQHNSNAADDRGTAVAVDHKGNVYMTGTFKKTVTFGTHTLTVASGTCCGMTNSYLVKYNSAGVAQWAKRFHSIGSSISYLKIFAIHVDSLQNLYITGNYSDSLNLNGHALAYTEHNEAMFVAKLDSNGNARWAWSRFGNNTEMGYEGCLITTDKDYNVIMAGDATSHYYLVKLDSTGAFQWHKTDYTYQTDITGLDVDDAGNAYITGYFLTRINFEAGIYFYSPNHYGGSPGSGAYVAKYSPSGTLTWAKRIGIDNMRCDVSNLKRQGNFIYISGQLVGTSGTVVPFGSQSITIPGTQFVDFLAKYDLDGNAIWIKPIWSQITILGTEYFGKDMTMDQNGNFYFTSRTNGTTNIGGYTHNGVSMSQDITISKYDSLGNLSWYTFMDPYQNGYTEARGTSIAVSPSNDAIYITGYFEQTRSIGGFTLTSNGNEDAIILKASNGMNLFPVTVNGSLILQCTGDSVMLSVPRYNGLAYQWYKNGTAIAGATDTFIVVKQPGKYYVSAANNQLVYFSRPETVDGDLLSLETSVTGNDVCQGQNGTITVAQTRSDVAYRVYSGNTLVSGPQNGNGGALALPISSYYLPASSNTFQVKMSKGACPILTLNQSATINLSYLPNPNKTTKGCSICGYNVCNVEVMNYEPQVMYEVYNNTTTYSSNPQASGTSMFLRVSYGSLLSGLNVYTVKATNSCGSVDLIDTVRLGYYQSINPNAGYDNTVSIPETQLYANVPSEGFGTWSIASGNASISDIHDPYATLTNLTPNTTVSLIWTITNGSCHPNSDMVTITYVPTVNGLHEINYETNIKVRPNPSSSSFEIDFTSLDATAHEVTISDITGKKLVVHEYITNNVMYVGENLPAGSYILTISSEKYQYNFKLLKK